MNIQDELLNDIKKRPTKHKVCYYPAFKETKDIENHYFRARWYMPFVKKVIEEVIFPCHKNDITELSPPDYMCNTPYTTDNITFVAESSNYIAQLQEAKLILVWNDISDEEMNSLQKLALVFNVKTDNIDTTEYGLYCKILWQMTNVEQKSQLLKDSHKRFKAFSRSIKEKNYLASAVFGTGPSIDLASKFDFSKCYTHACNTVVQSSDLLDHIKPDLLSAGDVVSHFGVSKYADKFRMELASVMEQRGIMFLTTAQFGYLFMIHYPHLTDQIFLCEQRGYIMNADLREDWNLPIMDSTFNIHMMPSAFTMSDTIFVLGCDGKNPDEKLNEDFWQHSKYAQYHDLVDSGHQAHPTFDIHRKLSTWDGYVSSVQQTCGISENMFGKSVYSLAPSYTPGLQERYLDSEEIKARYPFILSER